MSQTKARRAIPAIIISHWCKLIGDLKSSPKHFYLRLEQVLQERQVPALASASIAWREGGPLSAKRLYLRLLRERVVFDVCAAPFGTGFFVSWRMGELRLKLNVLGALILIAALLVGANWLFDGYQSRLRFMMIVHPEQLFWTGGIVLGVMILLVGLMRSAVGQGLADLDALLLHTPVLAGFYERFLRPITYYRIDLALMYEQAVHAAILQVIDELTESQKIPRICDADRRPILRDFYKR
jgi:hypothetical protein